MTFAQSNCQLPDPSLAAPATKARRRIARSQRRCLGAATLNWSISGRGLCTLLKNSWCASESLFEGDPESFGRTAIQGQSIRIRRKKAKNRSQSFVKPRKTMEASELWGKLELAILRQVPNLPHILCELPKSVFRNRFCQMSTAILQSKESQQLPAMMPRFRASVNSEIERLIAGFDLLAQP